MSQNSVRYYPYGEEYTATAQDTEKFATYFRDGTTILDYGRNRYYVSRLGRFLSAAGVGAEPIELGITAEGTVATPVAQLGSVACGLGVAKFGYDFSTVAYGYLFACR